MRPARSRAARPGERISRIGGRLGTVQRVSLVRQERLMHNLTVGEAHTFFVGQGRWLVHNACPRPKSGQPYRATFTVNGEEYVFRAESPRIYVPQNGGSLGVEFSSPLFVPRAVELNPLSNPTKTVGQRELLRVQREAFKELSQYYDEVKFTNIVRAGGGEGIQIGSRRGDMTFDLRRYQK